MTTQFPNRPTHAARGGVRVGGWMPASMLLPSPRRPGQPIRIVHAFGAAIGFAPH